MALSFTDEQLKTISLDVLNLPAAKQSNEVSIQDTAAKKEDALKKDQSYESFFNEYQSIIAAYHAELQALKGEVRTPYDPNTLISAAKQEQNNPHFPISPPWVNFQPKVISSNLGQPTSSELNELRDISEVNQYYNLLLTGFTGAGISDVAYSAFADSKLRTQNQTSFEVGMTIIAHDTVSALLGTITAVSTNPAPSSWKQELTITTIASSGTIVQGSIIRSFHPGYNNAQREAASVSDPAVLKLFEDNLDLHVSNWRSRLLEQQNALQSNDAKGAEVSEKEQALLDIQAAFDTVDSWESSPAIGSGIGKYGNNALAPLRARLDLRYNDQNPARSGKIVERLGNISQTPEGKYTGVGHYYSLFRWVDMRVSRIEGSLLTYYSQDLNAKVFDTKKDQLQNKEEEFSSALRVSRLAANGDNTDTTALDSIAGFEVGDEVKLISDDQPILTLVIQALLPNRAIRFNSLVPNTFGRAQNARLVKVL